MTTNDVRLWRRCAGCYKMLTLQSTGMQRVDDAPSCATLAYERRELCRSDTSDRLTRASVTKARQHSFATSAPRGSGRWLAVILARTAGVVAWQHERPFLAGSTSISRKDQARPLTKHGIAQWAGQASASQIKMNMAAAPATRAGSQLVRHRMGLVLPGRPKNTVRPATLAPIVLDEAAGADGETPRRSSSKGRWVAPPRGGSSVPASAPAPSFAAQPYFSAKPYLSSQNGNDSAAQPQFCVGIGRLVPFWCRWLRRKRQVALSRRQPPTEIAPLCADGWSDGTESGRCLFSG
jgi:hypothetical protein